MIHQEPAFEELRFVYQRNFLERAYPWSVEKCNCIPTIEGESLKQRLIAVNFIDPIRQQDDKRFSCSCLASSFLCKTFYCKDTLSCLARNYLLNYVAYHKFQRNDALPEYFIPVNEEIDTHG